MTFGIPRICTQFIYPPIHVRFFDWAACYADDEPNDSGYMRHGSGATETEAVTDLIENHPRED